MTNTTDIFTGKPIEISDEVEVQEDVVELLEDLLAQAKAGEVGEIIVAHAGPDAAINGEHRGRIHNPYAMTVLLRRLSRNYENLYCFLPSDEDEFYE